jgi:hypothetical protein
MIGVMLGVLFVRLGYDERGEFYYFTAREAQREEVRLGIYKPGHTSGDVREKLKKEEPKLTSEPTIRFVKLYGIEIVKLVREFESKTT